MKTVNEQFDELRADISKLDAEIQLIWKFIKTCEVRLVDKAGVMPEGE